MKPKPETMIGSWKPLTKMFLCLQDIYKFYVVGMSTSEIWTMYVQYVKKKTDMMQVMVIHDSVSAIIGQIKYRTRIHKLFTGAQKKTFRVKIYRYDQTCIFGDFKTHKLCSRRVTATALFSPVVKEEVS